APGGAGAPWRADRRRHLGPGSGAASRRSALLEPLAGTFGNSMHSGPEPDAGRWAPASLRSLRSGSMAASLRMLRPFGMMPVDHVGVAVAVDAADPHRVGQMRVIG